MTREQKQFDISAHIRGDVQEWSMWAYTQTEARLIAQRELAKLADLGGYIVSITPHSDE